MLSFVIFLLLSANNLFAQTEKPWVDISLNSTNQYIAYSVGGVNNKKYPPQNLFDSKLHTCWVSGTSEKDNISCLYLKLPDLNSLTINIFPGYGKSKALFYQNARPKKLKFTIYAAINPEGYVSEISTLYKAIKTPYTQIVDVSDSFNIQSFKLTVSEKDIAEFKEKAQKQYNNEFNIPQSHACLILKMEIINIYEGSKYNDICISEVFFNDCLIAFHPTSTKAINNLYLNESENALLADDENNKEIVIYSDTLSVLQIIEISKDKRWAIILSMPAAIEGRTATNYLLFDIINKKKVTPRIEEIAEGYSCGDPIFFEQGMNDTLYLIYTNKEGRYSKIKLRA